MDPKVTKSPHLLAHCSVSFSFPPPSFFLIFFFDIFSYNLRIVRSCTFGVKRDRNLLLHLCYPPECPGLGGRSVLWRSESLMDFGKVPNHLRVMPFFIPLWERRILSLLPSDPPRPPLRVLGLRQVDVCLLLTWLTHVISEHTHSGAKHFIGFPHWALTGLYRFQFSSSYRWQNQTMAVWGAYVKSHRLTMNKPGKILGCWCWFQFFHST